MNSINSFRQEVPSTLGTLKCCCLIRLAQISLLRPFQAGGGNTLDFRFLNGFTTVGIDASRSKQFSLRVPKAVKRATEPRTASHQCIVSIVLLCKTVVYMGPIFMLSFIFYIFFTFFGKLGTMNPQTFLSDPASWGLIV